jgi:curved DNA-binding protein
MDGARTTDKDYYYILGLTPKATSAQIQAAYEQLYDRFGPHVSVSGNDPEMMIKTYRSICEAYEVLIDPVKRQDYDKQAGSHLQKGDLRGLWGKTTTSADPTSSHSIEDTRMDIEVTLREAIKGALRQIRIEEQLPCQHCISLKPVQRLKCEQCRGVGFTRNARLENIDLPPGLYHGKEVRIANKGKFDQRGNRYADLVLPITVKQHSFFNVSDRDLCCTVPITILEAVLGGEIQVPTATGKVIMKIQPLTQNGKQYRLKGMGLGGGDLLVSVQVVVPNQISVEEVELFRKLAAHSTMRNPREEIMQKAAE